MKAIGWLALVCTLGVTGCEENGKARAVDADAGAQEDAGSPGAMDGSAEDGDAGEEPACATTPVTHLEIINACTDAEAVDKTPVLPLLNADGTLPPLP